MPQKTVKMLLFILLLAGCAAYIDWPQNPGLHIGWLGIQHPLAVRQGLDLQGGVRILLEPDPAQHYNPDTLTSAMSAVRDQIEQRVNGGLGVSEPNIRVLTSNGMPRISVELPAFTSGNQSEEISTLLTKPLCFLVSAKKQKKRDCSRLCLKIAITSILPRPGNALLH